MKINGNASFAAEFFSVSASFEYTQVRRHSSNTSSMTDPTFPFLMHLKCTNLPHSDSELRLVTRAGTRTHTHTHTCCASMPNVLFCGWVGTRSAEGTNTEDTEYCQTLT